MRFVSFMLLREYLFIIILKTFIKLKGFWILPFALKENKIVYFLNLILLQEYHSYLYVQLLQEFSKICTIELKYRQLFFCDNFLCFCLYVYTIGLLNWLQICYGNYIQFRY